ERADRLGAVLVLDDVRAGFRLHLGRPGEHVGAQPDLACYSKALGNAPAIAACPGREALREAALRVFYTGSSWTSAAAMAAADPVHLHPHHSWFISAALGEADVARVLEVTEEAFAGVLRASAG